MVLSPATVYNQLGQGHFRLFGIIQSLFRELQMNCGIFRNCVSSLVRLRTYKISSLSDRSINHRQPQSRVYKSPATVDCQVCCKMNQQIISWCCALLIITSPQITTVAVEQCHLTCFSLSYVGFI